MMKVVKALFFKARCERLYMRYTRGEISWNEFWEEREALNEKYGVN
jgi:hypothetical protein